MTHADPIIPEEIIEALRAAQGIVVLTGSGVSAESGVPTFRDALEGLWADFDPMKLATPEAFEDDPEMVSRWYDQRRVQVAGCAPNPGHQALASLERHARDRNIAYTLLTQNVDRLHQVAGSAGVVELHGSLFLWRCTRCGEEREELGPAFEAYPPVCACGGPRRPGVVWFGEFLPEEALIRASEAMGECDVFLSVGTSALVYPAAGFAQEARAHGARVVEINPDATPISELVDWSIRARSGEALPELVRRVAG